MNYRIDLTEDLYRRLLEHALSFDDQPADVIRRLLDFYEDHGGSSGEISDRPVKPPILRRPFWEAAAEPLPPPQPLDSSLFLRTIRSPAELTPEPPVRKELAKLPGLYLAPATRENLEASITRPVPWAVAEATLEPSEVQRLRADVDTESGFCCWPMTRNRQRQYDAMEPGDIVLFTERATGRFGLAATVLSKVISPALSQKIWETVGDQPWELIFIVQDVRTIDLDKGQLTSALGYDPAYRVPGIVRVVPERIRAAIHAHEEFASFLAEQIRSWRSREIV